jgi:hypothetical protein
MDRLLEGDEAARVSLSLSSVMYVWRRVRIVPWSYW